MSYTRITSAFALAMVMSLPACTDDRSSRLAGPVAPDWEYRLPVFNSGCNGNNASQLRVSSLGDTPQRLQQVIVYGTPVQRPYRGYGAPEMYGAVTQTFIYDRDMLDQCAFGTDNTFNVVGPVADDTLESPAAAPDGISQDVWNSLPPRVRKQLREAAWYLAEHWVPNDLPEVGGLIKEARRAMIFQVLVNGYNRAMDLRADRRRETEMFAYNHDYRFKAMTSSETMRADALIIGCLLAQSFRERVSWNGQQAEEWASRVSAGWASDATQAFTLRYLEPQLSRLAAIGAQLGREGDSCGSAARYHFENRPTELFDVPQGGGGGDNPFLF